MRQEKDVQDFLSGFEILQPGLFEVSTRRPDSDVGPCQLTEEWIEFGGVGRKL